MSILSFLGDAIKPITKLVDSLVTTDAERLLLHNELTKVENVFAERVLEYEGKLAQMKADVIMAEATGQSWMQRNWRPITMLTFLMLVVFDSFGWLANPLAKEAWVLLQIGLGGYVVGRSAEKIIPAVVSKLKKG